MRFILFSLLFLILNSSWAQVSDKYSSELVGYYRAQDLFEKEQFAAARKEFRTFIDANVRQKNDPFYIKSLYYEGLSALELFNNDAIPLLEQFNKDYPESIYRNDIFLRIGRYFYQKKDYKKALEYLAKLDRGKVENADLDEFYFKLGYANFTEKMYPEAKSAFLESKESATQYGPPSLYYYSHISYLDSSYQTALEGFERLLKDERFSKIVPFYIVQIYYLQGKYDEVVKYSTRDLDSLKPQEKVQMNHIIGDAFFKLGKYDEAVPYLEYYNQKANTSRDDDYALALAYSRSANCVQAVKYFDRVARTKDTLGQIALYNAGECYSNMNELVYARTAFEAASNLSMDLMIQEDALFRYAVLSYKLDMNAYDEAREAFELYLSKYPDSKRKATVFEYLVNVYTSTKNYAKALESLEKIPQKDVKLKTAYQLIAFNRGVELYSKSDFVNAIEAFKLVEKYPMSNDVSAKAKFWEADAYFMQNQTDKAIAGYDAFLKMPGNGLSGLRNDAYYNKGYAYLKKTNAALEAGKAQLSEKAIESFTQYVGLAKGSDKKKKADAYMRIADEYYRLKKDENAVINYKAAYDLKSGNEDQALYYMSKSLGFLGKKDDRIKNLLDIVNNYPTSKYVQRSMFEVAYTYYQIANFEKAQRYYEAIIKDYPNSSGVKDAYHFLGDIAFKQGKYAEAEKNYRKVLTDFTVSDTICKREVMALASLFRKQTASDKNAIVKLENLSKEYACADSLSNEVEDEYYQLAFNLYEDLNYTKAITEFDNYLNKYPAGRFVKDVSHYKADCLFNTDKVTDAVAMYEKLLEGKDDDFTEIAAQRVAKHYFNSNNHEKALPYYQRVEKVSSEPELLQNARVGQMRCHFLMENFESAAVYAKTVLSNNVTGELKLETEYIRGISLASTNKGAEAQPSLEYVVKNTTKAMASECKYWIAVGHYKKPDLAKTEATVRELLKMKPQYNYWIAKALILQTRVLMDKNDLFQAESTIQSVIENYDDDDDGIKEEANQLYDEIISLKSQPKTIEKKDPNTVIEIQDKGGKQ